MDAATLDAPVRKAAFDWLAAQTAVHGDVLPRALLARGFEVQGQRVPLFSPQGIFKGLICLTNPFKTLKKWG